MRSELSHRQSRVEREFLREDLQLEVLSRLRASLRNREQAELGRVLNATGILLHTSLGRSPLSVRARQAAWDCSQNCNLELDLGDGGRLARGHQVDSTLRLLTGAEATLVVNNNAAATVLVLATLAKGREVIISRGQLVEIGGSFRLPEIFATSGAILREVGSTNRTRLTDYETAVGPSTACLMRVHPSNYCIRGFVESTPLADLVSLGRRSAIPVIDDIGSGSLVDTTRWGLRKEPTFRDGVMARADLVLGSGDKLLGGPQCGIIVGRADLISRLSAHPLARAFRIDKLTLAALQGTLESYRLGLELQEIPILQALEQSLELLEQRARGVIARWAEACGARRNTENEVVSDAWRVSVQSSVASVGGGTLADSEIPSWSVNIEHRRLSSEALAGLLRTGTPRIFGRVQQGTVWLDLRSLPPAEDQLLVQGLQRLFEIDMGSAPPAAEF
jgi:L-seryl-tRNA(Ser) seleniumtransferase